MAKDADFGLLSLFKKEIAMTQHSITRVELHGATTNAEFEGLHKVMASNGFLRTIKARTGQTKRLPTATYHKVVDDEVTAEALIKIVTAIVETYWRKPRSFEALSTVGRVAWHNLPEL